jgi:hypothetical protein
VVGVALVSSACPGRSAPTKAKSLPELRATHERLHRELEERVSHDPVVARVFGDPGQMVLLARREWIEELMARVSGEYLDEVGVDLSAVEGHAEGTIRANTFLGRVTVGDWRVEFRIISLAGVLTAGRPSLSVRAQDELTLDLPVRLRRSTGRVALSFHWDSAALANLVCKDFELAQELDGVVLAQTHRLAGTVRFRSEEGAIVAVPTLEDRRIPLSVDLSPDSWLAVEAALRSQDSAGRCGSLMKPEVVIGKLRALAQRGIGVRLPESLVKPVRLPTRVEKAVAVGGRSVQFGVASSDLHLSPGLIWSSATFRVELATAPVEPATPLTGRLRIDRTANGALALARTRPLAEQQAGEDEKARAHRRRTP